jgi:nitrile hydratase accessory protein
MGDPRPPRAPLAIDGPAAPPRSNGELVFAEPWESRAFGMVVALHDSGAFTWETFQTALIERIAAGGSYYSCWLRALEDVLAAGGTVAPAEIETRVGVLASRPAGHDHRH